jgi:hypothetical protein
MVEEKNPINHIKDWGSGQSDLSDHYPPSISLLQLSPFNPTR